MYRYEEVLKRIGKEDFLSVSESFEIAKDCMKLLRDNKTTNEGRKIVVNILDNWNLIPKETYELWEDVIESTGFYPYLDGKDVLKNSLQGKIRLNYHKVDNMDDLTFHEEQQVLRNIIDSEKNIIVSAPTSFGKSLLIEYVVAKKMYKNIVVIQPTLALLDETRKKLKKYSKDYKIIVRTSQEPDSEKGNLFLLTAERVMEYQLFTNVDFLVVDEFYKFSAKRDDERSDVLNNACYKLIKRFNTRFYFLGPNIDGISEGFADKYNAIFYKTDFSLIDNKIIDVYSNHKEKFSKSKKYKSYKEEVLFNLLIDLWEEQTIIYCSSPSRVRELAWKFVLFINDRGLEKNKELPIIEWINNNISPEWQVKDFVNNFIGINDGALQKHINSSMIDYFNSGDLKFIFCTTTIIEGVNTSAKNVVIFDSKKGKSILLDYFDYSNIVGRSGRMMIHFIGKVYNFIEPPVKNDEIIVDIPFFQQNPIKDEVLINLLDEDVNDKESEQYNELQLIPIDKREVIKRNGVSVVGQLDILDKISDLDKVIEITRKNYLKKYKVRDLLCWTGYPSYDQLYFIFSLCFEHLIKPTETVSPMTNSKLTKLTFDYANSKSLKNLIREDFKYRIGKKDFVKNRENLKEEMNNSIREIFNISRHWFKFKVPKWLSVMNELQLYVFQNFAYKPGNYTYFSNEIENEFLASNVTLFAELGLPISAIRKIELAVPRELAEDQVMDYIKKNDIIEKIDLIEYEKWKAKIIL